MENRELKLLTGLLLAGFFLEAYVWLSLPECSECTACHTENGVETCVTGNCSGILAALKPQELSRREIEDYYDIQAGCKPAEKIVEIVPDCPVCEPETVTKKVYVEKDCPSSSTTSIQETGCPDKYIHCITNTEYMQYKNLFAGDKAACYQAGFMHCKNQVYRVFDLP